ncbi:MAG TPA: gluconate 2-dehydrogenase subunit 3 family protein [Gemmatimonadales bacterium]|nr:gluconate 2-dehydrogenase subunit 3 family protein [Gemmatimonadales bacterium]
MPHGPLSRRYFLGAMATGVAAVWWTGAARVRAGVAARPIADGAAPAGALGPAELRDVDAIAALVLPTDDTPGAREAHVVDFIDRGLATFAADQRAAFQSGLADLAARAAARHPGAARFAELPPDEQVAVLRALESEQSEFFEMARAATLAGMFANPEYGGNAGKLGWKLLGFEDRFGWAPPFGYYDRDPSASD